MTRLKILAIAVLCVGSAQALPLYNPVVASLYEDPCCKPVCDPCGGWMEQLSWGVGFVSSISTDHSMEIEDGSDYARVPTTQLNTYLGELTVNLSHRVELFGQLGTLNFRQILPNAPIGLTPGRSGLSSDTDLAWALGGRATLIEWGSWGFGAEIEYLQSRPHIKNINDNYPDPELQLIYREWQIGFGVAYHVCKWDHFELVPYFGARVGGTQIDADHARVASEPDGTNPVVIGNQKQARRWGTAVGITALANHRSFLNFEWDFLNDHNAVINFNIGF